MATNAGGIHVLRYGSARGLCLGVEAVLADGSILHRLGRVAKDNMGYGLRHLLIGAEGTLGLITAASLLLHPLPEETATAWIAVASPAAALALLQEMRAALGGTISAFELIGAQGLAFLAETLPQVPLPPGPPADWLVLAEAADGRGGAIGRRLEAALAAALERGGAQDALVAQNEAQRAVFWGAREAIPLANRRVGSVSSHDIALPRGGSRASSPRRARRWRRSSRRSGSTASGISGTGTCTTTSSRRAGGRARITTSCASR